MTKGIFPQRIDAKCINAIKDIIQKIYEDKNIQVSFIAASRLLGEKYFKGQLDVIPYSDIPEVFNHYRKNKLNIKVNVI
jgi:hypothetical protein